MPNGNGDASSVGAWLGPVRAPGWSAGSPGDPDGAFALHAALLHTGRVLVFSGYAEGPEIGPYPYRSWEFDPAGVVDEIEADETDIDAFYGDDAIGRWFVPGFEGEAESPDIDDDPDIDLFCSHHVAMPDGRLLVVGGDADEDGRGSDNRGLRLYDPIAHRWTKAPHRMAAGRWYPTAVAMPDGRAAIFSGYANDDLVADDVRAGLHFHPAGFEPIFGDVEVVGPQTFNPAVVEGGDRELYIYPGLVLVKGRKVYYVPTAWHYEDTDDATLETKLETRYFQFTGDDTGSWVAPRSEPLVPDYYHEEGTFVLLPPARDGRILVVGGEGTGGPKDDPRSCEILETRPGAERWVPAGRMHHERVNVSAVLLPTGEVLIVGGHDGSSAQLTPEIYDPSVTFDPDTYTPEEGDPSDPSRGPTAPFRKMADMSLSRMYHSTVLLLPDGRVLTAGGYDDTGHGHGPLDQRRIELFEPPYLHQEGDPPEILRASGRGRRGDEVRYGATLEIDYEVPDADSIETVALIRPGSTTHHTDTEQRYEDLRILSQEDGSLRAQAPADPSVVPPGHYMLWIVDDQGRPCRRAEFVRLSQRACSLVTDRSHFSASAYQAKVPAGTDPDEAVTVEFPDSLYVILHGFVPRDVGIHTATPSDAQLRAFAPTISLSEEDGIVFGVAARATDLHLEDPDDDLDARQRITFEYSFLFSGPQVFPSAEGEEPAEGVLQLETGVEGFTCEGEITLVSSPNPYMLDGDPHWLSDDLRVFSVRDGRAASGVALGPDDEPLEYLERFLEACRASDDGPGNPFSSLPTDLEDAELHLAQEVDGERVLNFAVARVHMQAPADVTASDVHVFFRLFVTEQPTLPYHVRAFPRSDGSPAHAELGTSRGEIVTLPFYGTPRSDVDSAPFDATNIQDMTGEEDGETVQYFGAWLDINDPSATFTDPSDGEERTFLQLIRGRHQCMVGEIFYESDEIPVDATPAGNDNLAQRNLAILRSDNPGGPDAHTVLHTFNVEPTWAKDRLAREPAALDAAALLRTPAHLKQVPVEARPDELAIFWGDVPRDAEATLYLPGLDADEIVELARLEGRAGVLEAAGPHTVRCPVADISYVPLPSPAGDPIAGLVTVQMPDHVDAGQRYRVVVRHYSRMKGRIEGSFELLVSVDEPDAFRDDAVRELAIFRHVARHLPADSRWRPIFERYLRGLEGRVAGLGVDPATVAPSPSPAPAGRPGEGGAGERVCRLLECVLASDSVRAYLAQKTPLDAGELARCVEAACGGRGPRTGTGRDGDRGDDGDRGHGGDDAGGPKQQEPPGPEEILEACRDPETRKALKELLEALDGE